MMDAEARGAVQELAERWWWFLVAGVAWLLVAIVIFRFDISSFSTVGVLLGVMLALAAANEFATAASRPGWRWAHILLGILFALGALWAFVQPIEAFWALASVFGLLLVLKGSLDIIASTMSRGINPLWGLGLGVGILEILLGFWASQEFFPANAALLLVWVGFGALFRGISEIVFAFELRSAKRELMSA